MKMRFQKEETDGCGCSCRKGINENSTTHSPSPELRSSQNDISCHQPPTSKSVHCQTRLSFLSDSIASQSCSVSLSILPQRRRSKGLETLNTPDVEPNQITAMDLCPSAIQTRLLLPVKSYQNRKNLKIFSGKVVKNYKKSRMRRVKSQEYKKLREMVPSLQEKSKVSKVVVIEETVKYIDELHSALIQRFRAKGLPLTFNGVQLEPREIHDGNIRDLIRRMLANANPSSLPPSKIENVRTLPSFLQKIIRPKKS